ncbi:aspartyl-phosphate phosphatase Spo0E family protein [Bacillus sp. V3B]|uniref:aspartyl-phosphate phosphatase Spo0E family protein n=1 Tax=Bacillus sp. V3B TaxID=2804915 RepID=UPI0021094221|nr:aspartyl-phosphate phosphatase Spo0E family protein [Bacillus sp. V3B]MCQ6277279.1 aspartyl-phosphate phosphatase Spo0E family protein [Bacillus sp. V3B]
MICELSHRERIEEIEVTRKDMILVGSVYGLTHPDTIKLSHRLDDLLNDLYKIETRE